MKGLTAYKTNFIITDIVNGYHNTMYHIKSVFQCIVMVVSIKSIKDQCRKSTMTSSKTQRKEHFHETIYSNSASFNLYKT